MSGADREPVTVPTVHLNGTSGEVLLVQIATASSATVAALAALYDAAPNARDYYVRGNGAFAAAQREHMARVERLLSVSRELDAIRWAIEEQIEARGRGRR